MPKYNYLNAQGQRTELDLEVDVYRAAAESEMSLSQYVNTTYPTSHAEASTFDQLCASSGLFMKADDSIGISPPTMKQVLQGIGGAKVMAGSIVRPDGAGSNTPSGRLLFPEVILQTILSDLTISNDDFLS
ncbi:MAG: hypothetical protein KAJ03_07455, partial [Gammaproteobacteria bacterium]|nr:hypothetical protein [Gammaproteobacteria bacterium]